MSLNLNKVILAGRLTATPELKSTPSGISVTTFSLAVDRAVSKDAEKKTDFINIVAWRKTAEFVSRYFEKGSPICIIGNIQTRSWEAQDGSKRYATEVIADEAKFVDSKNSGQANSTQQYVPDAYTAQPNFEEIGPDDDLPF